MQCKLYENHNNKQKKNECRHKQLTITGFHTHTQNLTSLFPGELPLPTPQISRPGRLQTDKQSQVWHLEVVFKLLDARSGN